MVRKWSYLNVQLVDMNTSRDIITRKYVFKVFRTSTKFRKYKLGLSVAVRKKYANRKHLTNWINLHYIIANWAVFYTKSKQFTRFSQLNNVFNWQFTCADSLFFFKKIPHVTKNTGLLYQSCSNTILNHFKRINWRAFRVNPFPHTKSGRVYVSDYDLDIFESSVHEIGTNSLIFEKTLVASNAMFTSIPEEIKQGSCLLQLHWKWTLKFLSTLYFILIKLTLIRI